MKSQQSFPGEMECEPLFAESDLEDESEVVEMEQETFLEEQTSFISPPYTLTLDTWQYQRASLVPPDLSGPSTSSTVPCDNEGSSQNGDVNGSNESDGRSRNEEFQPVDDDPRICSPALESLALGVDPVPRRYIVLHRSPYLQNNDAPLACLNLFVFKSFYS